MTYTNLPNTLIYATSHAQGFSIPLFHHLIMYHVDYLKVVPVAYTSDVVTQMNLSNLLHSYIPYRSQHYWTTYTIKCGLFGIPVFLGFLLQDQLVLTHSTLNTWQPCISIHCYKMANYRWDSPILTDTTVNTWQLCIVIKMSTTDRTFPLLPIPP